MKCGICGRDNLTQRELDVHLRLFHKVGGIPHPPQHNEPPQQFAAGVCPECGSTMWFEGGCATCHSCGYSKCG